MQLCDERGLLIRISQDECIHHGDSACAYCRKKMLGVWDVICAACGRVLCYEHANAWDRYWVCSPDGMIVDDPCPGMVSQEIQTIIAGRVARCPHVFHSAMSA